MLIRFKINLNQISYNIKKRINYKFTFYGFVNAYLYLYNLMHKKVYIITIVEKSGVLYYSIDCFVDIKKIRGCYEYF